MAETLAPDRAELLLVARLALGAAVDGAGGADWGRVFETAVRERCAPLAMLRSAEAIRALAGRETADRWRAHVRCAADAAWGQAEELSALIATLATAGARAGVLKGLPLARRLYGDTVARRSLDFDLHVPAEQRELAHAALLRDGWTHVYGAGPREAAYVRGAPAHCRALELHSRVLDESLLDHIELPEPEWEAVDIGPASVLAHAGPTVPVFLAAHLAKHARAPLLWWIDLAEVLAPLGDAERRAVRDVARDARLAQVLDWALAGIDLLGDIGGSDPGRAGAALSRLRAFHDRRNVVRLATLAATPVDACRVVVNWAWPPELRATPRRYADDAARRLRAVMRPRAPRRGPVESVAP